VGSWRGPAIGRRAFLRLAATGSGAAVLGLRGAGAGADPTPPSATEASFAELDGTPLCYWRFSDGTAGRRIEQRTFSSTAAFHDRLLAWVRDLRELAWRYGGLHDLQRIVTAGLFVAKPGQHGLGQAMDLDQVVWANGAITPYHREHLSTDRGVLRRYLALDAVCRRHFRWVLDGRYNADHADHLHMDFAGGQLVLQRDSRSETVFVQQVVNSFQGSGLAIDGAWADRTEAAFNESKARLAVHGDPMADPLAWRDWLLKVAACGFADTDFAAPPIILPDPLGALLEPVVQPIQDGLLELLGLLQ
jgi:hypothetical protein